MSKNKPTYEELEKKDRELEKEKEKAKQAEEVLRKSEETARVLLNATNDPVFSIDHEGVILYANEPAARRVGRSMDTIIGKCIYDFLPQNVAESRKGKIDEVFLSGKPVRFEDERDGIFVHTVYPVLDVHGKVERVAVFAQEITERKKAEEALRESEERYRSLFESTDDGIYLIDNNLRFLYANKKYLSRQGYSPEEIEGMDYKKCHSAQNTRRFEKKIKQVIESKKSVVYEHTSEKDGKIFLRTLSPLKNPITGEVENITVISKDITKRKKAEVALQESEDLLRRVINTAPPCIFVKDLNGKYIMVDKKTSDLHGLKPEEMLGKTDYDFVHMSITTESEVDRFLEDDREVIDSKQEKLIPEESFTLPDGTIKWFETIKVPLALKDNPDCVLGVAIDITERKKIEKELSKQRVEQQIILDSAPAMIFYKDKGDRFIRVNETLAMVFGMSKEEIVGKTASELSPTGRKDYWEDDKEVVASGIPKMNIIEPVETHEGTRWFQTDKIPYRDNEGKIIGILGFSVDITERRRAEEELRKSREKLRNLAMYLQSIREEERKHIARDIHDELGQILSTLKIDISLLREEIPQKQKSLIAQTKSISTLLDNGIRWVKRIASDLRPSVLDNIGVLAAIEGYTEEFQERKGIECELVLPLEELQVDQDIATAIFRVFQETMTNIARHANAKRAKIILRSVDNAIELTVEDNGIGIEEKKISASDAFGLIGMRERAQNLGGKLKIDSARGGGTKITLTVPFLKGNLDDKNNNHR